MKAGDFIRDNSELLAPPLVPELRLHLASEVLPLWRKTEEELAEIGVPPPYWAFAWAGGQALARYILDHADVARGKRVLDFGAGSGLVGLAAARAGASHVIAADIDPFAIAAVKLNARPNRLVIETRD
ncbi:MAG: methyltransferase, partial [Alphaproteobacteria bacterium]|nr:methyltransferase [Alphaproteobacteria bacterium]